MFVSTTCVSPVAVANVSSENTIAHGTVEGMVNVEVTVAMNSPRVPENPEVPNGSGIEAICPDPIVKELAFPITVPVELTNETEPVHDAAVPLEVAEAVLTTLTCAVSVLPSPTGGKAKVRVVVVELVDP